MEITATTKIDDLLRRYPFLEEYLVTKSPRYRALRNPVMRATVGKVATLERVAQIGGFELSSFLSGLAEEIRSRSGAPGSGEDRVQRLKELLLELHDGGDFEVVKEKAKPLIEGLDPAQIVQIGQSLVDAGVPETEVKKLSDIHSELFRRALEGMPLPEVPAGHPVHTHMLENRAAEAILQELEGLLTEAGEPPDPARFEDLRERLAGAVRRLSEINTHYRRKENQLFPILEARGLPGPPQVMWAVHDEVRRHLKNTSASLEAGPAAGSLPPVRGLRDTTPIQGAASASALRALAHSVREMIYKEERILFPMCLEAFTEEDWARVRAGEAEIGFAWVQPEKLEPLAAPKPASAAPGLLPLNTGDLTAEQVNLILTHLPVELTFVNEKNEVAYYSHGPERIFPRSPGIIGRKVQRCHPPESVGKVEAILEAFRAGQREAAEFWIQMKGRLVHIRYFAVRDESGSYRGALEVAQDVTEIRALRGERRLLDEG